MNISTERRPDWTPAPDLGPSPDTMGSEWGWGSFADIEAVEVHWLWYPYIPKGRLTSIEGDPGVGKSWMISAIAAAVSNGSPLPGQGPDPDRKPGKVLILSGEDGLADTIKPRLEACGAQMQNVHFPTKNGLPGKFILDAKGAAWLTKAMEVLKLAVVFIDPVQLFMGGKVDMNRANEVREFMDSLHTAAEKTDCAVILVRHFNKGKNATALYKGLGSIDFAASLRSILQVEVGEGGVRQAFHVKCNNAKEGDTITFSVSPFAWGPLVPHQTHAGKPSVSHTPRKAEGARAFIREYLVDGSVPAVDILAAGEAAGFTAATLNFAKRGIATSTKIGRDMWVWELVKEQDHDPAVGQPQDGGTGGRVGVEDHGPGVAGGGRMGGETGQPREPRSSGPAPVGVGDGPGHDPGVDGVVGGPGPRRDGPSPAPGPAPRHDGFRSLAPWEQELARITAAGRK